MKDKRNILLTDLIECTRDLSEICKELSQFGWDCDKDLIVLKKDHTLSILGRYLSKQLSGSDVEEWANAIEGREDVGFESGILRNLIHELANPMLTKPLSEYTAKRWILKIENSS